MTSARAVLFGVFAPLLCGVLSACKPPPPDPTPIVRAWMQCQDCMNRERERVVALGDIAVPQLRDVLLNGPPPAHILAVDEVLQEIGSRAAPLNPAVMALEREGFRSMYRIRASAALVEIGTPAARTALCDARANVPIAMRPAVDSGIATTGGPCP